MVPVTILPSGLIADAEAAQAMWGPILRDLPEDTALLLVTLRRQLSDPLQIRTLDALEESLEGMVTA